MTPPEHIRAAKNTGCAKQFARFEKSDDMSPKNTDAMAGIRSQNPPNAGITLQE